MRLTYLIVPALICSFSFSFADDKKASTLLATAESEFAKRTALTNDEVVVTNAVQAFEDALKEVADPKLKYEILVNYSRTLNWKGLHTKKEKPVTVFEKSMQVADDARKTKGLEKVTEGHYFYAVALGRWALEKGPLTVLGKTPELKAALNSAQNGDTMAGEVGETVDSYGPDRVYGRMYMELPALAGGDRKLAKQHLEKAYTKAPEHTLNAVYYAQSLEGLDLTTEACQVIADLLKKDPAKMIPERVADATEDMADAKRFQKETCTP